MVERIGQARFFTNAPNTPRGLFRARTSVEPRIALVLGSGLGGFADDFEDAVGIPYQEIPGFRAFNGTRSCGTARDWQS